MDKAKISIKFSCFSLSLSFILDKRKKHKSFFVARIKWRGRGKIKKKKIEISRYNWHVKNTFFFGTIRKRNKKRKKKKATKTSEE